MESITYTLKNIIKKTEYSEQEYKLYFDELTDLKNGRSFKEDLEKEPFYSIYLIDIDNFRSFNNVHGVKIANYILKESVKHFQTMYFDEDIKLYRVYGDGFIIKTKKSNVKLEQLSSLTLNHNECDKEIIVNYTTVRVNKKEDCLEKLYLGLKQAKETATSHVIYTEEAIEGSLEVA